MKETIEKKTLIKSNHLVEARYRLTLQEMQILLWLLTQIKTDDEDFKPHTIEIKSFAKIIGVLPGNRYSEMRAVTRNLMRRIIEIYEPEKKRLMQISWLSSAIYDEGKGTVSLQFDPNLKPHLLRLKNNFTKIDVTDTLKLKSTHSIRILEILLQYSNIGERIISTQDLRLMLGMDTNKYKQYGDFKKDVLLRARDEITKKTRYKVDFSEIKESRKVVAIHWTIIQKDKTKDTTKTENTLSKEYRSSLALIEALIEYGFTKPTCIKMIKIHGEKVVSDAVKAVDIQIQRKHAKNPKAMLRVAIKEHWKPDVFKESS